MDYKQPIKLNSCFVFNIFDVCFICNKSIIYNKIKLPCDHYFHKRCIKPWISMYRSCPVCSRRYINTRGGNFMGCKYIPYFLCNFR